jgi:hypothetical protein
VIYFALKNLSTFFFTSTKFFLTELPPAENDLKLMKKISEIQTLLTSTEQLSVLDLGCIKGGGRCDDKRRARPGGGTTTTSPSRL